MPFADTLRQLREQEGLTQAKLAEKAHIPLRTIQGWEQGYRCPVSPDFFRLARALGVSADAFAESEELARQSLAPRQTLSDPDFVPGDLPTKPAKKANRSRKPK